MYGMLLESIQHFVQEEYGEEVWKQILEESGFKNAVFTTHQVYPDRLIPSLAHACSRYHDSSRHGEKVGGKVDGDKVDDFLCFFGRCFVRFFTHYGYDTLIRASGRYFRDFLNGIDNLHHQIRFSYPKMQSPSFYVESEHALGARLHYRSKRSGFGSYVVGQLVQIAKQFYGLELEVTLVGSEEDRSGGSGCHLIYDLRFDNSPFQAAQAARRSMMEHTDLDPVSCVYLFRLFPFSMAFDRTLRIREVGEKSRELFGGEEMAGMPVDTFFLMHRPRVAFTWDNIYILQKVVVELECLNSHFTQSPNLSAADRRNSASTRNLLLKGQMRLIEEWDAIIYLCVPLLSNLQEMQEVGLYLTDLCLHDSSREIVLAGWQHGARLEISYEKQEERSRKLEQNLKQADEWKQKGDDLLYSMIPKAVALRLRNGEDAIETCESFDSVTVLFGEIVAFSELCSRLTPMEAVTCVNDVFSLFDNVTDAHNVFKVETVGQVYMLVSGAPERRPDHAQGVARAALDMVARVRDMDRPDVMVRIGMHSGPVAAGVVGLKMPRYCLFGDTVNTAARMQSHGEAGKIHISNSSNTHLKTDGFITEPRGSMKIKGKGEMNTYWLLGLKKETIT